MSHAPADSIIHALAFDDTVRVIAATTTRTVAEAIERHDAMPTAAAALGRALTAALLVRDTYKSEEQVSLRFDGKGPLSPVFARALADGSVYGSVRDASAIVPQRDGRLDVGAGIGIDGVLVVTVDRGTGEPQMGTVDLATGEVGDDVAHYFALSQQTQSAVGVGVMLQPDRSVGGAGGFLIQLLADAPPEAADDIAARLDALPSIAALIRDGAGARELVRRLAGDGARILSERAVRYRCPRVRQDFVSRIASLGREALDELFFDEHPVEVLCEFCRETYRISRQEVDAAGSST